MKRPGKFQPGKRWLILASASARRQQLLRQAKLKFRIVPSDWEEGEVQGNPYRFARQAAENKARQVAKRFTPATWVLAADTLVLQGQQVFGKPRSRLEAQHMLQALSGRTHMVITGVALFQAPQRKVTTWVEKTRVQMRRISRSELTAYLDSQEWQDKAGAYGIQGQAGAFVTRIVGCYFNVVGLPLGSVCAVLTRQKLGR